jgi:hypothetical protein
VKTAEVTPQTILSERLKWRLKVGEGLFHCYPVCSPLFPEAREAMEEICAFIGEQLAEASARALRI